MRMIKLEVWVLATVDESNGDCEIYCLRSEEEAREKIYELVANWWDAEEFENDEGEPMEIGEFDRMEAVQHYYENRESEWYTVNRSWIEYRADDLQNLVYQATMGMAR